MMESPTEKLNIFVCSANEDQDLCEQLRRHLTSLRYSYGLSIYSSNDAEVGKDWKGERRRLLYSADLVLLLMSADFLADNHCYEEMQRALELEDEGRTIVVFVLLRPVNLLTTPFQMKKALPQNGKPLTEWNNLDAAFANISTSIGEIILKLRTSQRGRRKLVQEDYAPYERAQFKRYIYTCNQAIRINPNDAAAYSKKGWALYELRRFRRAIPVLKRAIFLNPKDASAYFNRGRALSKLGRFEKAIPDLKAAIRLDPYDPVTRLVKGEAFYKLERFEDALSDLKEAINLDPFLDKAYLVKSRALHKLKRFEEATFELEEAIRLDPYNRTLAHRRGGSPLWSYEETPKSGRRIAIILGLVTLGGSSYLFYSLVYPKKPLISLFSNGGSIASVPVKTPAKVQAASPSSEAHDLIQQYYDAINKQDYHTAYNMWGDNLTGNGQSYDQFVGGYGNTLHDEITFDSIDPQGETTVDVSITIHATERSGTGTYSAQYVVGVIGESWKIISGSSEKMALSNALYQSKRL